jgi:hypothetical protein
VWFVTIDAGGTIFRVETLAIDARHYQRAAQAWLTGADPWAVTESGIQYAAGPHTLLFYAPTSLLPLPLSVGLWMAAGLAASVWLIRRLGLPIWWLAFPPLTHALWNGNPQSIVVALLVAGGSVTAIAAVGLKLYAAAALIRRWRDVVLIVALLVVTLPLLPIGLYLEHDAGLNRDLSRAWNGSAWAVPALVAPVVVALWVLRKHGSEWLAVPAVWPLTQFYYVSMAIPALVGRPWLAAAFALPVVMAAPLAVIGYACLVTWPQVRRRAGANPSTGRTSALL